MVLEARDTGRPMDSQAVSGKRGQLLCVVSALMGEKLLVRFCEGDLDHPVDRLMPNYACI